VQEGTYYLPIHHLFCNGAAPNDKCGVLIPGTTTVAYLDNNHLNSAGTSYLWPFVCSFLKQNGLLGV
jgi:hypothetical protein